MLGSSLASTLLTFDFATCSQFSIITYKDKATGSGMMGDGKLRNVHLRIVQLFWMPPVSLRGLEPDLGSCPSNPILSNAKFSYGCPPRLLTTKNIVSRWKTRSAGRTPEIVMREEDTKTWEDCRQALSGFEFTVEEEDKILGKAFGFVHSPYWSEEREKVVPKFEEVDAILDYLRGLGLSDDDISKMLKKFPEVVGCSLENELKMNIQILEKQWGIKGKSLRNLLLRNPKVLGYNVDCKGDCMALCTRCWVRF